MRAVVYDHYGPPEVLRIAEVPEPVPRPTDVLVRVRATTVNRLDCHTREANRSNGPLISVLSRLVSGLRRPRNPILGSEVAGEVVATGAEVTEFKVGDRVFANTGLAFGCHAELTRVPQSGRIAQMPEGVSFTDCAAVSDGFLNALWCLRLAQPKPGQKVLVYGASGAIGTAGVQLARHFGAEVTAVCGPQALELARTLGAAHVIDYTAEDFTRNGVQYDVIFDAVGKHSFARSRGSLKDGGSFLVVDGLSNLLLAPWTRWVGSKRVRFRLPPVYAKKDVAWLRDLLAAGEYRAVIDRAYPLDEVVEAARYVDTGQKTGSVVLTIGE